MKFSHTEENRDGRHLDVLIDEENGLRIIVSRLGAELISLARINEAGRWTGFLYRDNDLSVPSQGWANHATVMGYYLHRLKDGRSFYRGHEIKGGTHSFLRTKTWHFVEARMGEGAALTYRITPQDFSATEYPLEVSLDLTYKIDTNKVSVAFEFRNGESELTAHIGFGLHPGFAATSFDSFRLQMPAGCYRRHCAPPLAWLPNWPLAIKQPSIGSLSCVYTKTHRGIEPRRALFFWSASLVVAARVAA